MIQKVSFCTHAFPNDRLGSQTIGAATLCVQCLRLKGSAVFAPNDVSHRLISLFTKLSRYPWLGVTHHFLKPNTQYHNSG
jgi:hypothetical protein